MTLAMRSKGLAWGVTLNNGQGVAISYANSVGLGNLGWKFYLVYMALDVVFIIIIYLFFPETYGKTLEEVALIFDGNDSMLQIRNRAEKDMNESGLSSGISEFESVGKEEVKVTEKS